VVGVKKGGLYLIPKQNAAESAKAVVEELAAVNTQLEQLRRGEAVVTQLSDADSQLAIADNQQMYRPKS
jgi:hypothetical protein